MGHSSLNVRRVAHFKDGDLLLVIALALEASANDPTYAAVLEEWRQQLDQGPGCIDLHLETKWPDDLKLIDRLLGEVARLVGAEPSAIPAEMLNRWVPTESVQFLDQDRGRAMRVIDRLRRFVREGIEPFP